MSKTTIDTFTDILSRFTRSSMSAEYEVQLSQAFHPRWEPIRYFARTGDTIWLYSASKMQVEDQDVQPLIRISCVLNKSLPIVRDGKQELVSVNMGEGHMPAYIRIIRHVHWCGTREA